VIWIARIVARCVAGGLAVIAAYLLMAWIGSTLPGGNATTPPADGISIWVETNGIHTGLIVPMTNEHADFTAFASADHARAAPVGATHMLVGWGHAGVYRETPRWRDLKLGDALSAIFGSNQTVLHVTFLREPQANNALQRRIVISAAAYRRLAARITERFARDGAHQPAYGDDDVFYDSVGRYSWLVTCNSWTGNLLREAGVPMGRWTPFAGGVMKWLPAGR
jgi:uncharacterized protein (TIGR02117 family)